MPWYFGTVGFDMYQNNHYVNKLDVLMLKPSRSGGWLCKNIRFWDSQEKTMSFSTPQSNRPLTGSGSLRSMISQ